MALKKACFCLSLRTGSLLFLFLLVISCALTLLDTFTDFDDLEDPVVKVLLNDYPYLYYADVFTSLIGGLICSATFVSIIINKHSTSIPLLFTVIAFLLLVAINKFYCIFQLFYNGLFDILMDTEFEKQARELPPEIQDSFRKEVKKGYPSMRKIVYTLFLRRLFIIFYSMLVFHGYIKELKKNFVGSGSVRENDENNETKFSQACVYFQPTAPEQELTQAPQCIIECNKKDRMPTCVSPVIMV